MTTLPANMQPPINMIMRTAIRSTRPVHHSVYTQSLRPTAFQTSRPLALSSHPRRDHFSTLPSPPRRRQPFNNQSDTASSTPIRSFTTTARHSKDHHFDTLKFTRRLQEEGLSEAQASALMKVLGSVLEESIQNLTRTMVPREDALKTAYTQKIDFNALRTELLQSDTSEATLTKTTHDRLQNEVQKLGQRLRDEVERTKSGVKLDLNLEKGRTKDEREAMEMRIRETETRIEQEVAGLRERVEGVKFDTVRWLAGVVTGTMALLLGAWRLFM